MSTPDNSSSRDDLLPPFATLDQVAAKPAYSLPDACFLLGLPPPTMRKLMAEGIGPPFFTLGRRLYVLRDDFEAWLRACAGRGINRATPQRPSIELPKRRPGRPAKGERR